MPQCVSKMVKVSNLYLQRGAAKILNKALLKFGCKTIGIEFVARIRNSGRAYPITVYELRASVATIVCTMIQYVKHIHSFLYIYYSGYKVQLTKTFDDICQLPQLRRPHDVVGESDCRQADRGAHHHCLTQRPQKHRRDILTEEADRCRRKLL